MEECARSESSPIACRTWLGSIEVDVQAEPDETAMSRICIISASLPTPQADVQVRGQALGRVAIQGHVRKGGEVRPAS